MARYEDGTMDVKINGQIERRKYRMVGNTFSMMGSGGACFARAEPELQPNEGIFWEIASDIPCIYKETE